MHVDRRIRVTTHLENLEKSGNWSGKSGTLGKVREIVVRQSGVLMQLR